MRPGVTGDRRRLRLAGLAAAPGPTLDKEYVDMGQNDGHLRNAPALPKNPKFKRSTKKERRVFMAAYNLYISQMNALTANGVRPFIMPKGFDVDPRALDTLKKRIKSGVVFDISAPDADSRIGRMLDGFAAAIRRDCQEWVIREESQGMVKIMTDAVKPASLHRAVTEQMALTRNKPLKKDVYRWLREYAIGHERFVGYEEELKPPARPDLPKPPGSKQLLRTHGSTFGRGRGEKAAPGVPGGRMATVKTNVPDAKRPELPAIVDGVLAVQASLLDSGADLSVASGGLVSVLLAAGASPEITVLGPMELRPYGADSQHLLNFTLGLPVMQKLGYNEQTLLENARRQQAVWDFGDQPITTPGVAMHPTLRMGELSDGIDDDEGMACATPELGNAPDDDGP
ncbi:hypothetical protein DYB26_015576, partial [Aphanomyces astaci]